MPDRSWRRRLAMSGSVLVSAALLVVPTTTAMAARAAGPPTPAAGDLEDVAAAKCTPLTVESSTGRLSDGSRVERGRAGSGQEWHLKGAGGANIIAIAPPDGFNPAKASDAELAAFGLPARPSDATMRRAWTATWDRALHPRAAFEAPCETTQQSTSLGSGNWSGRMNISSGFSSVSGNFVVPTFAGGCAHASSHTIWAGIGGWQSSNGLIQAGVSASQTGVNDVWAWFETWPREGELSVNNPQVRVGDAVSISVTYDSSNGGTATFHIGNISRNDYWTYKETGVSRYYDSRTVEWIDERPRNTSLTYYQDDHYYYYRQSTNTVWSSEAANGHAAGYWATYGVYMSGAAGVLATAALPTTSTSTHYWRHC